MYSILLFFSTSKVCVTIFENKCYENIWNFNCVCMWLCASVCSMDFKGINGILHPWLKGLFFFSSILISRKMTLRWISLFSLSLSVCLSVCLSVSDIQVAVFNVVSWFLINGSFLKFFKKKNKLLFCLSNPCCSYLIIFFVINLFCNFDLPMAFLKLIFC